MNKALAFFGCLVFLAFLSGSVGASTNWWDANYDYRQQVTVTNNAGSVLESGYTVDMSLDVLGLVGEGKAKANGNDVRVVYWDGTNNVELDRILDIDEGKVTFMIQADIPPSGNDANHWVYYAYPSAGASPANWGNVFLGGDGSFKTSDGWSVYTEGGCDLSVDTSAQRLNIMRMENDRTCYVASNSPEFTDFIVTYKYRTLSGSDNAMYFSGFGSDIFGAVVNDDMNATGLSDSIGYNNLFVFKTVNGVRTVNEGSDISRTDGAVYYVCTYHFDGYTYINVSTSTYCASDFGSMNLPVNDYVYDKVYAIGGGVYTGKGVRPGTDGYIEDFRFRKYLSPEPTTSLGVGEDLRIVLLEARVAALEEKTDLLESTVNTLKDFVKKIYDALPAGWKNKIGDWPF